MLRRLPPDFQTFFCPRCKLRNRLQELQAPRLRQSQRSSSTRSASTPGYFPPLNELNAPAYTQLTDRALIRLQGPDVVDFLNGLLPAKLHPTTGHDSRPIFTTFLSAKGRILYEVFVYPPKEAAPGGSWYMDTNTTSVSALFSHLKKHKLRSKFKLEKVPLTDLSVFYVWPSQEELEIETSDLGGQDPRPLMGTRMLLNTTQRSPILSRLEQSGSRLSLQDYNIHRMLCGHAEGPLELVTGSALPQESNIDFDEGIDFHKGCYLGQELTIRTHHTGVVRKRILPCQIYPRNHKIPGDQELPAYDSSISVHQPPHEANISKIHAKGRSGRSTGKWLGGVGNIGLALCRLEMMTDVQLTAEGTAFDRDGEFAITWEDNNGDVDGKAALREVRVKPFVPSWIRDNIQAGIQARSDRSKRRRQEEDDDEDEVD